MQRLYRRMVPSIAVRSLQNVSINDTMWQHYWNLSVKRKEIPVDLGFYQRRCVFRGSDIKDIVHSTYDTLDNEQGRLHKHVWYFDTDLISYYNGDISDDIICISRNWCVKPFKGDLDEYESYSVHLMNFIPVDSSESEINTWETTLKTDWKPEWMDFNEFVVNYVGSICPHTQKELIQRRIGWASYEI